MNQHPYLRAYMAGIALPTAFLLIVMTAFTIARYVCNIPLPIERVIVFPMAVVPNLWGLWNILYIALLSRHNVSIGIFGALLPLLIGPLGGVLITQVVNFPIPLIFLALPIVMVVAIVVYYLVWKYLVGFLNHVVGIA